MKIKIVKTGFLVAMLAIGSGRVLIAAQTSYAFKTIDVPSAEPGSGLGTRALGMCGTNIVGFYRDTNLVYQGFLYSPGTWTTLTHPSAGAGNGQGTCPFRIAETNIVGAFVDAAGNTHGFLYNGNIWTTLDHPQSVGFSGCTGIDGTNIVGWYLDRNNRYHGFLYNGVTWQTLDAPGAIMTTSYGISGSNIVGNYSASSGLTHGYLYDVLTRMWVTIDDPLGTGGTVTYGGTVAYGVGGNNILGGYVDLDGHEHGFLATPIPALTIESCSNGPKISWPYCPLVSWTLEQTPDLTTPDWTPLGGISNDGTNHFISITPSGGKAWFRLRQ